MMPTLAACLLAPASAAGAAPHRLPGCPTTFVLPTSCACPPHTGAAHAAGAEPGRPRPPGGSGRGGGAAGRCAAGRLPAAGACCAGLGWVSFSVSHSKTAGLRNRLPAGRAQILSAPTYPPAHCSHSTGAALAADLCLEPVRRARPLRARARGPRVWRARAGAAAARRWAGGAVRPDDAGRGGGGSGARRAGRRRWRQPVSARRGGPAT